MKDNFEILGKNPLFERISKEDCTAMMACLGAYEKPFSKNSAILLEGDPIDFIGIVLYGGVKIVKTDINGNEHIVTKAVAGQTFAEVFACADVTHSPVSMIATENSNVLFLNYRRILHSCTSACEFHHRLVANMIKVIALRNLELRQKIDIITKRTLREKILAYLEASSGGEKQFTIDKNREELANFLCADRSALSNELSKLQKEGVIAYQRNHFQLLF
ncbi:MAG: Crp/Fnr family transcriptional regulator [Eubacteriales bacterium]